MKIAVLSDIHGNLPALEVVLEDIERWAPDRVVVNGDLINRGPHSLECLELLRRRLDPHLLQGNHEEFVRHCAGRAREPDSPTYDLRRFGHWTADRLGGALTQVAAWPGNLDLTDPDGGTIHITHGSRLGSRDGIHPGVGDDELAAKVGDPTHLFITSHTHKPLVRDFNGTRVVNVGSVGTPLDRDPRAAYGRFTFGRGGWAVEIVRLAFDRARAERDFRDSGFLEEGGPLTRLIHAELREARSLVGPWMRQYHDAVRAGEVTVAIAVERYLEDAGL